MNTTFPRAPRLLTPALLTALLVACGGPLEPDELDQAEGRARPLAAAAITPPLFDDNGQFYPPVAAALPADPGARTRHGRYATLQQAAQLEDALGVMAIPVAVEPGADMAGAADLAQQMVWGHQAVHDLPADAPVLVRSSDLRLGAAVVHQLEAAGYTRVLLVTR